MRILLLLIPLLLGVSLFGAVRTAAVAGQWYPADADRLRAEIERYMESAPKAPGEGHVRAIVVPHAGYVYSASTAALAFRAAAGSDVKRVILIGTSHYSDHGGFSVGDFDAYETPLGRVPVDREAVKRLLVHDIFAYHRRAHAREHSLEAQIPFVQVVFPKAEILTILPGYRTSLADDRSAAQILRDLIDDHTLVVISTDFTHYGRRFDYTPFRDGIPEGLRRLDLGAFRLFAESSPEIFDAYLETTGATICGRRALRFAMSLFPKRTCRLLGYTTSGSMEGNYSTSVSYLAAALYDGPERPAGSVHVPLSGTLDDGEKRTALELARATIETTLRGVSDLDRVMGDIDLTGGLGQVAGAFVTLNRGDRLRGCIGYIEGVGPLYRAIMDNAVSAATKDYRFPSVTAREMEEITIEISVLSPLKAVPSADAIELGRHGVVLTKGGRRAVFLPQVATETGWTKEEFLNHLSRKAGLSPDAWREGASFEVFTAQVFHE